MFSLLECMHFVQLSENPEIFKLKVFSMIMVEKPETAGCLLQFLEMHSGVGRSLARNHISICFSPPLDFPTHKSGGDP